MALLKKLFKSAVLLAGLQGAVAKKPNILFILTDDQDWHMKSLVCMLLLPSDT